MKCLNFKHPRKILSPVPVGRVKEVRILKNHSGDLMFRILNALVCLFALVMAVETRAGGSDNLRLTQYKNASDIPSSLLALGGGSAMTNKTFKDDDGNTRSDKIYYTGTHSYTSSYRQEDILRLLNPSDGKLGNLFEDTSVNKSARAGLYDVLMKISTPIKNFDCSSTLTYKTIKSGNKNVFTYSFTNFNMVFTDMVIQIEVDSSSGDSQINVKQIMAMKGSTYSKLKNVFAVGKFEKAMKENMKRLKDGVGGI